MRIRLISLAIFVIAAAHVLPAQVPATEYAARRDSLAAHLPEGVLLALGAHEPRQDYESFVQTPDFLYLTGIREPEAALVMDKRADHVRFLLFVQSRDPAREAWTGERMGITGAAARTGLETRPLTALRATLDTLLRGAAHLFVIADLGGAVQSADDQLIASLTRRSSRGDPEDVSPVVQALRARHSAAELDLERRAIDITVRAEREAMHAVQPGMNEFELQALIEYTFRRNGADRPAFATIVGSGPNATSLHYNTDDRFMRAGDLVVMDIGASYRGYAADVTRTIPVSGTFTPEQRAIYTVVRSAQAAAERQARLGNTARAMDDSANAALLSGLASLGLVERVDAIYDPGRAGCRLRLATGCSQLSLYYIHGLGHGIGLEVHDPDPWSVPPYRIVPGSAFTIEPGIYVRADLLDSLPDTPRNRAMIARLRPVIDRYRDIGVRIEDDYFATDNGVEWVSRAPRELEEVEAAMRDRVASAARRDSAVVNWYRQTAEKP